MNSLPELELELAQLLPLIQERLAAGQSVRFSPMGISMLPMLRQKKDSVVLSPVPEKLKKYDLPLYRRDNGKFVLHRVLKVGDTYTCCGDNQFVMEPGIRHDQVIGLVTAFYRGEKFCSVHSVPYRLYCRVWHKTRSIRLFYRRTKVWLKRHL